MDGQITGIQQAGIGVLDADSAKHLYKELFGMNVLIFEDKAEASLMTHYTGKQLHHRYAILSLNMQGGGGFEIWQFTSRKALKPDAEILYGDLGINAIKIKSRNVNATYHTFLTDKTVTLSPLQLSPDGKPYFFLKDSLGNQFQIVEGEDWFKNSKGSHCGGVAGAVIGVSNMEKSIAFYSQLLGIDEVVYDEAVGMDCLTLTDLPDAKFRRVLLKKGSSTNGAFSKLLGSIQIELIEVSGRVAKKIFENRYWGDCGFIHLCFDVLNMDDLKEKFAKTNYPFTVDSKDSFSMGTSAGRFCYAEDPDGTLIELVETHKIPVLKKAGIYIDLKKRNKDKPLPDWMIGLLALNKIR